MKNYNYLELEQMVKEENRGYNSQSSLVAEDEHIYSEYKNNVII